MILDPDDGEEVEEEMVMEDVDITADQSIHAKDPSTQRVADLPKRIVLLSMLPRLSLLPINLI